MSEISKLAVRWWKSEATTNGARVLLVLVGAAAVTIFGALVTAVGSFVISGNEDAAAPNQDPTSTTQASLTSSASTTQAPSTTVLLIATTTGDANIAPPTTSEEPGLLTTTRVPPTTVDAPESVSGVSLLDLSRQSGSWDEGPLSINGVRHISAASNNMCGGANARTVVYTLSGAYDRLTGTVGMRDETPIGARSIITIATNGKTVVTQEVEPNTDFPVDVNLKGANSLQITFTAAGDVYCERNEGPAIGSPQITGA